MNKLNWWPLANSLVEFLKNHKDELGAPSFEGVFIYAGTKITGKVYPCIEITFDAESNPTGKRGLVNLWVDVCLKNNNSNPSEAYELMFKYQTEIMNLIFNYDDGWPAAIKKDLGIATDIKISNVISDGDSQRPVCQCRMVLEIDWRGKTI